jgi:hypothetical protein
MTHEAEKDVKAVELLQETQRAPALREKLLRELLELEDSLKKFRLTLETHEEAADGAEGQPWLK